VLDDFHLLNNSAVLDSVAELLRGELPVG
jgi:hypothetical protein